MRIQKTLAALCSLFVAQCLTLVTFAVEVTEPAGAAHGYPSGHFYQMIVAYNFSPGNMGLVLPIDILMPIVGFVFLWLSYKHPQPGATNHRLT